MKRFCVATVGPSCRDAKMLHKLASAGVNCFRINLSHENNPDELIERISTLPIHWKPKILVDLQGPKFRIGKISETILEDNQSFIIDRDVNTNGGAARCGFQQYDLLRNMKRGDAFYINDGMVKLNVIENNFDEGILMEVKRGGVISSFKGVNIPNLDANISSLSEKDYKHIDMIKDRDDVDWVALSFVRSASDVMELKELVPQKIMAKIETPESVANIKEIVHHSDAIMVARGDLGIEVGLERLPVIQKRILNECVRQNVPAVVATQMFESMTQHPLPTRAEVNDVAHAIWSGASGVMLSGETSVGKYPLESVEMLQKVMVHL